MNEGRFDLRVKKAKRGRTPKEIITDRFLTLYLLHDSPIGQGNTKLQKLSFLSQLKMSQQRDKGTNYNFIKLPKGPWSPDLKDDIEDMVYKKIITGYNHEPTQYGLEILGSFDEIGSRNDEILGKIRAVNEKYALYDRDELVDLVHKMRNPDKPNLTIHETNDRWYVLKRPTSRNSSREFMITEGELASLELLFEPDNYNSVLESLRDLSEMPAERFSE